MINVLDRFCCLESTHILSPVESQLSDTKPSVQSKPQAIPAPIQMMEPAGYYPVTCSHPCSAFSVRVATGSPAAGNPQFQAPKPTHSWSRTQHWQNSLSVWNCGGTIRSSSSAEHPQAVIPQLFLKYQSLHIHSRAACPSPSSQLRYPNCPRLGCTWLGTRPSWKVTQQNKRALCSFGFLGDLFLLWFILFPQSTLD